MSVVVLVQCLIVGVFVAQAATLPFVTVWRTTIANETIALPFSVPVNTLNISWGDGQSEIINGTTVATHSYDLAGLYNMSIVGDITGFRFNSSVHASKLMEIADWGDGFLMDSSSINVFAGCVNLQVTAPASSQPVFLPGATLEGMFMNTSFNSALDWNLTNVTSVARMFMNAQSLNQPLRFSNTLGVTSTVSMFQNATAFNWDFTMQTDNVVNMQSMFQDASSFNQTVAFNTGKVQYMNNMFNGANSFDQPINFNGTSLLQTDGMFGNTAAFNSAVNLTNTFALTSTFAMFYLAVAFNQPITFQTDNVVNMGSMFQQAGAFNQPLTFNTGKVQSMYLMLSYMSSFNQDINFDTSSLASADYLFCWTTAFNRPVNFTNTSALTSTFAMFQSSSSFNQPITFQTDSVRDMGYMFFDASSFNQSVPFNTRQVQSMQNMFGNTNAFAQPINFDATSLTDASRMFAGASAFNNVVNLTNTSALTIVTGMFSNTAKFNQPIHFDGSSLLLADSMFANANAFNSAVNFTNTSALTNTASMFEGAAVFNQAPGFGVANVSNMSSMFKGARAFNQALPWPSTDTRKVLSMASMFEDASSFNQTINFQVDKLVSADNLLRGATSFNQPVALQGSSNLTSMARMLANATNFSRTVNVSSTASVVSMRDMFVNVLGFEQNLRDWNVSLVADCSNFCYWCGLPNFQQCVPCAGQILASVSGMSVCNCPSNEMPTPATQCGAAPTAPTTSAPTIAPTGGSICNMVQVSPTLQVECTETPSPSSPSPSSRSYLTGIVSPLFNITRNENNTNDTSFVFTLPIDPRLYTEVGTITRPCESQQLSCEWQNPETLEFLKSGCAVSRARVDMGSGVIGTECTCTHLTVFAIALRSEMQLAPLCQAQEVDYVLMTLYAILGVSLVVQVARILRYQPVLAATRRSCCVKYDRRPSNNGGRRSSSGTGGFRASESLPSFSYSPTAVAAAQTSFIQHALLLLVCVLRIAYLAAKPVIGSLAGLVALGLLPSAFTLSLFIHLLLTWASLQLATFEASPFDRFRVPFMVTALLVFVVVIVLAVVAGVTLEVDAVRDGSYVLAALYAVVCVLTLLSGLGMRKSIPVVDAIRSMDWRVVFRCRLLVVTLGLSTSLFVAACLWVAAVQTDIVTSTAATLATTVCFYVFDWLSLCVLTWLFSFAVKEATEHRQLAGRGSSRRSQGPASHNNSRRNSGKQDIAKSHTIELGA